MTGSLLLTKTGATMHIVHLMAREDVAVYTEQLFGDRPDVAVTPMTIVQRFYEIRQSEIDDIFQFHFGLSGDFSVVFYDRFGKKKRAMTAHSEHSNVPSMSGGYSQSSMTVRDHETQLKMAMEAYFRADDDGNFSTKKAKTLQIMDDAATLAEEEGGGVAGVLPALEEVTEAASRPESGGGPMMEMTTMKEVEAGAETERN